jgi:mercuric ion transport protein
MNHDRMLRTGIVGTGIMAICCFTPALVVLVTAVGLSAVIGYLDYVLFPALAVFAGVTGYAIYLRSKGATRENEETS